jgi:hypothetical protein
MLPQSCPSGQGGASRHWVTLCARLFSSYKGKLEDINCDALGDQVPTLPVPGAVMLHELTHWHRMMRKYANVTIVDHGYGS